MKNILGMCFNRNVLIGLGLGGLALFVVAPNLALAALPFLLLAACPLSMVLMPRLMGWGMHGSQGRQQVQSEQAKGMPSEQEEQLVQLRTQLQTLQELERTLVKKIAELDTGSSIASLKVAEVEEEVARETAQPRGI